MMHSLTLTGIWEPSSSDDGEGRVSKDDPPSRPASVPLFAGSPFRVLVFLLFVALTGEILASPPPRYGLSGLSAFVDAGLLIPNAKQAIFYDGRPDRPNTIDRVLHSEAYGHQIWSSLKNQGYLQGVGSYSEITLADYPEMYYKLSYQIGLGFRYDYDNGLGWMLRFDYSTLTAAGIFHINNTAGATVLTNQDSYINCNMVGRENRIYIDLGLLKRVRLAGGMELELSAGFNFNNTKVKEHQMQIGGQNYSILDVWGSNNLYSGIGTYEYINQGGIGYGCFGGVALCYAIATVGSVDLGYDCYYTKTVYRDFNESDAFALQHVVFLRVNVNNFSFFGKD
ncbi:MAG: hypothetical protein IJ620_04690 [Bacteroidales bacterium]|nr:hypothetical protein [Bacteroidales bacterium]